MNNKAIFLDRDGTINIEKQYLYKIEEFEFASGALDGLKMLKDAGFLLFIITNQSGIARGYYSEDDFRKLNDWMLNELENYGIHIEKVSYCPHHPSAVICKYKVECSCRKPNLGMYEEIIERFNIDIENSWAVGDKIRDCSICNTTNCRGILVGDSESKDIIEQVNNNIIKNVIYKKNLYEAAEFIVEQADKGIIDDGAYRKILS